MGLKSAVCLTGDVHHMSMRTPDQVFLKSGEADSAIRYSKICEKHGLETTIFLTGKFVLQENASTLLAEMDHVELGGHGFDGFRPSLGYKLAYRFLGRKNGPRFWQYHQVARTITILKSLTGKSVLSWRNHALRHDQYTAEILKKQGIKFWSDVVRRGALSPYVNHGLVCVPINTLMDHDTMVHGARTFAFLSKEAKDGRIRGDDICSPDEWLKLVLKEVDGIVSAGGVATILAHPACMEIADGFRTFETLCSELKHFTTIKMRRLTEFERNSYKGFMQE